MSNTVPHQNRSERLAVRVPAPLADALRAVAEREDRTVSDELRHLIRGRVTEAFTTERTPA